MADDSTPLQLPVETGATNAPNAQATHPVAHRTSRVVGILFALFLALLGTIAMTGSPAAVNAAAPHSLRAVTGEGCGGG